MHPENLLTQGLVAAWRVVAFCLAVVVLGAFLVA